MPAFFSSLNSWIRHMPHGIYSSVLHYLPTRGEKSNRPKELLGSLIHKPSLPTANSVHGKFFNTKWSYMDGTTIKYNKYFFYDHLVIYTSGKFCVNNSRHFNLICVRLLLSFAYSHCFSLRLEISVHTITSYSAVKE